MTTKKIVRILILALLTFFSVLFLYVCMFCINLSYISTTVAIANSNAESSDLYEYKLERDRIFILAKEERNALAANNELNELIVMGDTFTRVTVISSIFLLGLPSIYFLGYYFDEKCKDIARKKRRRTFKRKNIRY